MKHPSILGLSTLFCAAIAGCASAPPATPGPLHPPEAASLIKQLHATGVQIYECAPAKSDASQFEWVFKGPEAKLTTKGGSSAGKHYAGPTWESNDGSRVVGEMIASSPSPQPNSIPWLLLRAKATAGNGLFTPVRFIQRVNTVGGALPAAGCRKEQAGQQLRAAYSADYLFYGVKR
jgi:Protein of unknown function (DUF3455)